LLLLEYACVYLPCQQNAVVEAVSKGVKIPDQLAELFGIPKDILKPADGLASMRDIPFTPFSEIENQSPAK